MGLPWGDVLQRIGHYFRLQVLGVLAPGALLLLEVGFFFLPPDARANPLNTLLYISMRSAGVTASIAIAGLTISMFVAYTMGFLTRQVVWSLLLATALKGPGYDNNWDALRRALARDYSCCSIEKVIREHPALYRDSDPTALGLRRYAKLWLRLREPQLSTDYLEAEINILFSNMAPFALAPFVVTYWAVKDTAAYFLIASSASLCIIALLVFSGRRLLKSTEPYETVFSFLVAHWIRADSSKEVEADIEPQDRCSQPN